MDTSKYTRNIVLLCPTCGTSEFSKAEGEGDGSLHTCLSCSLVISYADLIASNSEAVQLGVEELKARVTKDLTNELKKAFAGNRHFKVQ